MPRQAHGRPLISSKPAQSSKRKQPPNRRGLGALEEAERQIPEQIKIRQHRLGKIEDESDDNHDRQDEEDRSTKRRKTSANLGEDQDEEDGGSGPDGNEWHVGVDEEDEDSDIDSDEAFGESDEEKFAGYTFRGGADQQKPSQSKGRKQKSRQPNLDEEDTEWSAEEEDEDENSDDLGDEAVDLATAFDMNEKLEQEEQEEQENSTHKGQRKPRREASPSESSNISDSSSGDGEDDRQSQLSISDYDDEDGQANLQRFVEGLSSRNKESESTVRGSRQSLPDKPSQYGLGSSKLTAADLLQFVKDPQQRKSLKILQENEKVGPDSYTSGVPGKLAAPLAKRQQDRLDRAAAYDQSKATLNRWIETVKANRRAEHISFPLPDPAMQSATNTTALVPVSQSAPVTALEATIEQILQESGQKPSGKHSLEQQAQEYEELQENQIPLEELQARRAELRKARDLMFREEIRARRLKKIKSKAFRRIHRKERDKGKLEERANLLASGQIDSEEEREKNDKRRAEERMGSRHRESKWAKAAKSIGRAAWDEDARQGVAELARRDQELRRRVDGKSTADSDLGSGYNSESDYNSDDERAYQDLEQQLVSTNATEESAKGSKLANMAFMQKAEAARKAANDNESKQLKAFLRGDKAGMDQDSDNEPTESAGRQKFGVTKTEAAVPPKKPLLKGSKFEEKLSDEDDLSEGDASVVPISTAPMIASQAQPSKSIQRQKVASDWLQNDSQQSRTQFIPEKQVTKSTSTKDQRKSRKPTNKQPSKPAKSSTILDEDYTSPSDSDSEPDTSGNPTQTSTADNIRLANALFAGDDEDHVMTAFAHEKADDVASEDEQTSTTALPGWGSWTGSGVSKKSQSRALAAQKRDPRNTTVVKAGVAPSARQDKGLERIIINEKRVKKNDKYLATELPHPFENKAQYERSLRLPLGPEWQTKKNFQDNTKPRVLLKQGVIKAMERPMV